MDYLVLARKWRPQRFGDVVGQEHVAKTLTNAILQKRVAHALLFSGPRGVGKTSVARILAKALNCEKGPSPEPCQECANCREITAGSSMDVREIDGASNRGIDEMRELREHIAYAPLACRSKLYIIDEVHMLTREAFNALLKTLEEPPLHALFVLATTELQKVPATIISRCQCHAFRMIPLRDIAQRLRQIAEAEGVQISAAGLGWVAQAGGGSMRDAQSVFDQLISFAGLKISDADVEELLCLTDRRFLFMLSGALARGDVMAALSVIRETYEAGLDMKHFYHLLLTHVRNMLFLKLVGPDSALFDLSDGDLVSLHGQVSGLSRETLQAYLDTLLGEEEGMRRTQDPRLLLETVVVRMACQEALLPFDEILERLETLEKRLSSGDSGRRPPGGEKPPPSFPEPAHSGGSPEVREERKGYRSREDNQTELWDSYKAFIKKHSTPLGSKVEKGVFLGYHDHQITLGFSPDYIFIDDINNRVNQQKLVEISSSFFGAPVQVRIEILERGPSEGGAGRNGEQRNSRDIRQEALNSPALQKILDVFEGADVSEVIPRKAN